MAAVVRCRRGKGERERDRDREVDGEGGGGEEVGESDIESCLWGFVCSLV